MKKRNHLRKSALICVSKLGSKLVYMKKSLLALASGTLGLGIAEFVMMGILPNVAHDLGISIPQAGHFISARRDILFRRMLSAYVSVRR